MRRSFVLLMALPLILSAPAAQAVLSAADVEAARSHVENLLESRKGPEFGGSTIALDVVITTVNVTTIGMALCSPPNPNAPPDFTPTPPYNSYGCVNNVTVTATLLTNHSMHLTVTIPHFFVDLRTSRPELPYCFECVFNCGNVVRDGYASASPLTYVCSYNEISGPGGTRELIAVPGSSRASIQNFSLNLGDGCLSALSAILTFFDPGLEGGVEEAMERELNRIPIPLPLPVESSTWGAVKALYAR